jgi:hypothetical protein
MAAAGEQAGALVEAGPSGEEEDTFHLLPASKGVSDAAFKEFYSALDDVLPTARAPGCARRPPSSRVAQIPDGLTEHYLERCGFPRAELAPLAVVKDGGKEPVLDHRLCASPAASGSVPAHAPPASASSLSPHRSTWQTS